MRLFVAVRPPEEVLDLLAALPRPERHGIRWTPREQWHVTLRFLGEVDESLVAPLSSALAAVLGGSGAVPVALRPATARLGRAVLAVPAEGVDDLAAAVLAATVDLVPDAEAGRPFRGHLTLARCPRGVPTWAVGEPVAASWAAGEVHLVRSTLGRGPARHDVLAALPLA